MIVTLETWPVSTWVMKVLKLMAWSLRWNRVEKFQTRTPTTTSTIQNSRLFRVEFTNGLPTARNSRLPRTLWHSVTRKSRRHGVPGYPDNPAVRRRPRSGTRCRSARGTLRSTNRSCTFFRPEPSGRRIRSPGCQARTTRFGRRPAVDVRPAPLSCARRAAVRLDGDRGAPAAGSPPRAPTIRPGIARRYCPGRKARRAASATGPTR